MDIREDELNSQPIFGAEEKYDFSTLPPEHCFYCGIHDVMCIVRCSTCNLWFCSNTSDKLAGCHIYLHVKHSKHSRMSNHPQNINHVGEYSCSLCPNNDFLTLQIVNNSFIACRKCALKEKNSHNEYTIRELVPGKMVDSTKIHLPAPEEVEKARAVYVRQIKIIEKNIKNNRDPYQGLEDEPEFIAPLPKIKLRYKNANEYHDIYFKMLKYDMKYNQANMEENEASNLEMDLVNSIGTFSYDSLSSGIKLRLGSFLDLTINSKQYSAIVTSIDIRRDIIKVKIQDAKALNNGKYVFSLKVKFTAVPYERMFTGLDYFRSGKMNHTLQGLILGTVTEIPKSAEEVKKEPEVNNRSYLAAQGLPDLNESQESCVRDALDSMLCLIQGPPGTGKTHVSATAIKHLVQKLKKKKKMLVSSSSNVAVDNLVERLTQAGVPTVKVCSKIREQITSKVDHRCLHVLLRQYIQREHPNFINTYDMKVSFNEELRREDWEVFLEYTKRGVKSILDPIKVICCTNIASADERLDDYKFAYVLIDEANQATEPEVLLPLFSGCEKLILVGDQMQLGPLTKCGLSATAGLNRSLFSRLIHMGHVPFTLQSQYRMHPSISAFPNTFCYEGRISDGITADDRELCSPDFWPTPNPVLFLHHEHSEGTAAGGTSFINSNEAYNVFETLEKLFTANVKSENIVVLTPYEGQKKFLIELLESKHIATDVFNIDEFQGNERDYVIISTVRSNESNSLGFLSDFRRLNVAITRARFGLIIVGNAEMTSKSKLWGHLISHYNENNLIYTGGFGRLRHLNINTAALTQYDFKKEFPYAS